ncbi:hypothetical protein DFP72DRAFT_476383 [Ephemerocybe angulata]|uniref:Uncharacterized protein n=1 Tax=Ephemerocybe angulata TaxID=980116 RepID=A0A8H6M4V4_9AGAR|nr:hypothetical protein DFP72DRAFT_476383 [Tulosesus angulatus]
MADTAIRTIGLADIALAGSMIYLPEPLYKGAYSVWVNSVTGYKIANPAEGPGFAQGLALMLVAIGVAHLVASVSGPGAKPTIFAINAAAAVLAVLSIVFQKESGLACTMTVTMAFSQSAITVLLYLLGAASDKDESRAEKVKDRVE